MTLLYVISSWCRMVLLLIFFTSMLQKLRAPNAFHQSVVNFAIVPSNWVAPIAWLFIGGEGLVVLLLVGGLLFGEVFRLASALGAMLLLLVFSGALLSVLVRGLHIPCGCFG